MKCFNKISSVIAFAVMLNVSSCGLDDRNNPNEKSNPPQTSPPFVNKPPIPEVPPAPTVPILRFQWSLSASTYTLERTIVEDKKQYRAYYADFPLTLPTFSVDYAEFEVKGLPLKLKNRGKLKSSIKVANANSNSLFINPTYISQDETERDTTGIRFTLSGLSSVLKGAYDVEQQASIQVTFTSSSPDPEEFSIYFILMTPPSKVIYTQRTLREYESVAHTVPDEMKYLEDGSNILQLLQVIELSNFSSQPVSVDLPSIIKGKLWQKSKWFDPQYGDFAKELCFDLPQTLENEETYSTELVALPFNEKLLTTWEKLLREKTNSLLVSPGEKKLFGLYARPTSTYKQDFKTLLKRRSPKEFSRTNPIQTISIDTKCNFTCITPDLSDLFKNHCASLDGDKKECGERVQICQTCFDAIKRKLPTVASRCNSCHEQEFLQKIDGGKTACLGGWQRTSVKSKQAPKGTELGSIHLEIEMTNTLFNVRYGNLPKANDPEGRTIPLLSESSIQDQ